MAIPHRFSARRQDYLYQGTYRGSEEGIHIIQEDKTKRRVERDSISELDLPKSGRDIMDLAGPNASATDLAIFRKIGLAYDTKQSELSIANSRIQELEAQIKRIKAKKRKAIPNPNKKFIQLRDIMEPERVPGNALNREIKAEIEVEGEEIEVKSSDDNEEEDDNNAPPPEVRTQARRATKKPSRYTD